MDSRSMGEAIGRMMGCLVAAGGMLFALAVVLAGLLVWRW